MTIKRSTMKYNKHELLTMLFIVLAIVFLLLACTKHIETEAKKVGRVITRYPDCWDSEMNFKNTDMCLAILDN